MSWSPDPRTYSEGVICGSTLFYFITNKQTNKLYLTRVTLNSEITDKPVALGFQIELEFGNVGF